MTNSSPASDSIDVATAEELAAIMECMAQGDLSLTPRGRDRLSQALRTLVEKLRAGMHDDFDTAIEMAVRVNESAICNAALRQEAGEVTRNISDIAVASEEVASAIGVAEQAIARTKDSSQELRDATSAGRDAAENAEKEFASITRSVESADKGSVSLRDVSKKISDITSTIVEIAMKTNLLAVNASIEAARAGAAGRGFAIVAEEVRALSDQTAGAANDIRQGVKTLWDEVDSVNTAMEDAKSAIKGGSDAVEQMKKVAGDVSSAAGHVDGAVHELASMLAKNTTATREAAENVNGARDVLMRVEDRVVNTGEVLDRGIGAIGQHLRKLAKLEGQGKLLRLAKVDHVIWKKRLADLLTGKDGLRADELSDPKACRVGKFIYGPSSKNLRYLPDFAKVEAPHKAVHEAGVAAVEASKNNDFNAAMHNLAKLEVESEKLVMVFDQLIEQEGRMDKGQSLTF